MCMESRNMVLMNLFLERSLSSGKTHRDQLELSVATINIGKDANVGNQPWKPPVSPTITKLELQFLTTSG